MVLRGQQLPETRMPKSQLEGSCGDCPGVQGSVYFSPHKGEVKEHIYPAVCVATARENPYLMSPCSDKGGVSGAGLTSVFPVTL